MILVDLVQFRMTLGLQSDNLLRSSILPEFTAIAVVSGIIVSLITLGLYFLCCFFEDCYLFSAKFRLLRQA